MFLIGFVIGVVVSFIAIVCIACCAINSEKDGFEGK